MRAQGLHNHILVFFVRNRARAENPAYKKGQIKVIADLSVMKYSLAYSSALLVLLAQSLQTQAQEQERGPWSVGVAGGAVNQFEADFSDGPGSLSVTRAFAQASISYSWNRKNSLSLSVGAGTADYDFSSEASIEGREPWGRINDYRISLPIRFTPTKKTAAIVIPSIRTYAETGASKGDGKSVGFIGGFSYEFSDSLSLGPGMGWFDDAGDETSVFPIVLIDWRITDRWRLSTGRGLAASQGPGFTLNYKLNDKWTTGVTARYENTRFSLKQSTNRSGSIGEDSSAPLLLVLDYSPWPMTSISALLGVELGGSLSLEDERGNTIAESDLDTAVVAGISFSSRF